MSHVFPLRTTAPALRRLALVLAIPAALLGALDSCGPRPAYAQEATCRSVEDVKTEISAVPFFSAPREVDHRGMELVAAVFNSAPPESNNTYNFAMLVDITPPAGGGGFILIGNDGQVCGALRLDAMRWQALLRSVEGLSA